MPVAVAVGIILAFFGLTALNALIPLNPVNFTKRYTDPLARTVGLPVYYDINLSQAFTTPQNADPYVNYVEQKTEGGLRLDTAAFINQVDSPEENPFKNPQVLFSPLICEGFKKYDNNYFTVDFPGVFFSANNKTEEEAKITEKEINFTNLEENRVFAKVKMFLKPEFFQEMEKHQQEAIKTVLEEKLKEIKDEDQKKQLEAYLFSLGQTVVTLESIAQSKIDENNKKIQDLKNEISELEAEPNGEIVNEVPIKAKTEEIDKLEKENENLEKAKKVKKEGYTAYYSLNEIVSPHLIELRYQYDPNYILVRNGQIFPLKPGETTLKAKVCEGVETDEIKVIIPQEGFKDFNPTKKIGPSEKYGVYDAGFLIGKAESQKILEAEINKILEKNYITGATLQTKSLHYNFGDGKMEIYLSPDGGKTWIAPNEKKPTIDHPGKNDKEDKKYLSKSDTFTYTFPEGQQEPQDFKMVVVAQNLTETGVREWSVQWTDDNLEKIKDKKYSLEKKVKKTDSGYMGIKTLFLLPKDEEGIKVKDNSKKDNPELSDIDMISKYKGLEYDSEKKNIRVIKDSPFYTQISFLEKSVNIAPSGSTQILIGLIKEINDKTEKITNINQMGLEKNHTGEFYTDPSPIDEEIATLEQDVIKIRQSWPEDLANQKTQVIDLVNQVTDLKNDFINRKTLDQTTLNKLNNINIKIDSLNSVLQDQISKPTSFNLIPTAKAADGLINNMLPTGQKLVSGNYPVFSTLVLPYSTPVLSSAEITFNVTPKPEVPTLSPIVEAPLDIYPSLWYRGHSRIIVKWSFASGALNTTDPKSITFKYGENANSLDKGAIVHQDKNDGKYYVVLRGLKGGEYSDKQGSGWENGRFNYYYTVSANSKTTPVKNFKTLNRMQTIGYYYTLVLDRDYLKDQSETNLDKWKTPDSVFAGKAVKDLENGGIGFWYKPPEGKEPLTLSGVKFAIVNDRLRKEFDNKLSSLEISEAVRTIYRKYLDRIYDEDLGKFYDTKGVEYWVSRTDPKIVGKDAIDIFGVKFAISVSPEAQEDLVASIGAAEAKPELAYEIVLKRGADKSGLEYLKTTFAQNKEMRKHLAQSEEYNSRLSEIEKNLGRQAAIAEMYETLYSRASDIKGVEYWDKTGLSFDILKQKFLSSDEFVKVIKE